MQCRCSYSISCSFIKSCTTKCYLCRSLTSGGCEEYSLNRGMQQMHTNMASCTSTRYLCRFLTSGSVAEDILNRAKQKMVLAHLVIQQMDTNIFSFTSTLSVFLQISDKRQCRGGHLEPSQAKDGAGPLGHPADGHQWAHHTRAPGCNRKCQTALWQR